MSRCLAVLLGLLTTHASQGATPPAPLQQRYGDWTVACDNVRACSAQGYRVLGPDEDEGQSDSQVQAGLWLARDAGPQGAAHLQLHLGSRDGQEVPEGSRVDVRIGGRDFRRLPLDADLPPAIAQALVRAMVEAPRMRLSGRDSEATVSLQGLKAALLKMDDTQGRVGTVTAWVAKGQATAARVPLAPPLPVLVPAAMPTRLPADAELVLSRQLVRHPAVIQDCYLLQEDPPEADRLPETAIHQIRPKEYLVLMECARAAYQTSYRLWRVKQGGKAIDVAPEVLPDLQEPALDLMNAEFNAGKLSTWHKGRGLGDCGGNREWVWTASGFALRLANEAPDCNGIYGGGPGLTLWQAEVQPVPKPASRP